MPRRMRRERATRGRD
ncbi:hypothetical protein [Burkholderia lata]